MKAVVYKGPAGLRGAGERGDGCALVASPAEDRQPGERDGNTLGHDQPNAAEEAYARDRDLVAVDDGVAKVEFSATENAHQSQAAASRQRPCWL